MKTQTVMKTATVITTTVIMLIHFSGFAAPAQTKITPLTLEQAKAIALAESPTLASARERIRQAKETIVQARAAFLPDISINGAWNYTQKTEASPPGTDKTLWSGRISATQLLFDGFQRKYAALAAEQGEHITRAAHAEARRLLTWSVAQSYLNVQLALENIKIAQSDIRFNQRREKEAAAKEKSGAGSLSDRLNFKTKVNTARAFLITSDQDLKEACNGLAALMGYAAGTLPPGTEIAPLARQFSSGDADAEYTKDAPDDLTAEAPDSSMDDDNDEDPANANTTTTANTNANAAVPDQSRSGADPATGTHNPGNLEALLSRRPDLQQAAYELAKADADIHKEKSALYPTISLTGSYGSTSAEEFSDLTDTDEMGAAVEVNVNFDLYEGGAVRSRIREAASVKKEREKELSAARITAASEIRTAYEDLESARRQLILQQENKDLMEKMRDLVQKEYDAGQASLVRLNEAQNELVNAMGDLAIARVSLILAREALTYYTADRV